MRMGTDTLGSMQGASREERGVVVTAWEASVVSIVPFSVPSRGQFSVLGDGFLRGWGPWGGFPEWVRPPLHLEGGPLRSMKVKKAKKGVCGFTRVGSATLEGTTQGPLSCALHEARGTAALSTMSSRGCP